MARTLYGLSLADYAVDPTTGAPLAGAQFNVWNARSGGTQVTDLTDLTGDPVNVVTADPQGYLGFNGPDGYDGDLWLQGAAGVRLLVRPGNLTSRVDLLESAAPQTVDLSAYATTAYVDSAISTATGGGSGTPTGGVAKDTLFINLQDHGISPSNTYSANQTALVNLFAAAPTTGAHYFFPAAGTILIDGGIDIPPNCTIQMSDPTGQFWGYNPSTVAFPVTKSAFRIRPGSTVQYGFRFTDNFGGDTTRDTARNALIDFTLLGGQNGTNMTGLLFAGTTLEQSFYARNVRIVGFTGDGISTGTTGKMWVHNWHDLYIGGCGGYGLSATGTAQIADVWLHSGIITGCVKGGVNIDTTGNPSGQFFMRNRFRVERSNWDPAAIGAVSPTWYGAPGVRIRGNIYKVDLDISTDANSGPGVDIVRVAGRTLNSVTIAGLISRDGWYDMTNGGAGGSGAQAGIRLLGASGNSIDYVNLTGTKIIGGRAQDGGTNPTYYHPSTGVLIDGVSFLQWADIIIDPGLSSPYTIGTTAGGIFRSQLAGRAGPQSIDSTAVYTNTAARPGQTGQPAPFVGMQGWDAALAKPIWYGGSPLAWRDATGTAV